MRYIFLAVFFSMITNCLVSYDIHAQEKFKYDRENKKYWDGVTWRELDDDRYENIIFSYEPALSEYNSGKTYGTIGMIFGGAAGFSVGYGLGIDLFRKSDGEKPSTTTYYIVGGALIIPGIVFAILGNNSIERSAELYEEYVNRPVSNHLYDRIHIYPYYNDRNNAISLCLNIGL